MSSSRFPREWRTRPPQAGRHGAFLARALAGLCFWLGSSFAHADDIELNPSHPERYTVVKGDTLWDIAGKFLNRPWQWSEIWHANPEIRNPDLIYPGDVLVLSYVNGKPQLHIAGQLEAPPSALTEAPPPAELRLGPRVRSTPIEQAIPAIPMTVIRQFLTRPRVVGVSELESAPYVTAFAGEHIVGGAGNRIYVRAIENGTPNAYTVVREGAPYKDAESGETLGYEAVYIGDSHLERTGDPATLFLDHTEQEVRIGDRLLPVEQEQFRLAFHPHAPKTSLRGHIIGVLNGVSQIGQYSIVALDRGTADGVEVGHVLEILEKRTAVRDIVSKHAGETIDLPDERAGLLMVFRPFERISYAPVMQATQALHVLDAVQPP